MATSRYIASASLVNGPALEINQSLRNLTRTEHAFNETLPPYLKLGARGAGPTKDTTTLVAEFNRRKEELEQKARDFKPNT